MKSTEFETWMIEKDIPEKKRGCKRNATEHRLPKVIDMRDWNVELTFVADVENDGRDYDEDGRRAWDFLLHFFLWCVLNFDTFSLVHNMSFLFLCALSLSTSFPPLHTKRRRVSDVGRSIRAAAFMGFPSSVAQHPALSGALFPFFHGREITLSQRTLTQIHKGKKSVRLLYPNRRSSTTRTSPEHGLNRKGKKKEDGEEKKRNQTRVDVCALSSPFVCTARVLRLSALRLSFLSK